VCNFVFDFKQSLSDFLYMDMSNEQFIDRVKNAMKERGINQKRLAKMVGVTQATISRSLNIKSEPNKQTFFSICDALDLDHNTAEPTKKIQNINDHISKLILIPLLGSVAAGPPSSPSDSVMMYDDLQKLHITPDAWNFLFPKVIANNLVALRVSGSSMSPRHYDGDIVFIRRTQNRDEVNDGQKVIIELPGDGHTFKIWRKSGVLESVNPTFSPIPCPRGARLWGIYICGTRIAR
jgi:SOS-response transcriptional repressor LexA